MRDVTGLSGSALAIHDEFKEVMDAMPSEWRDAIRLGFTDTPSPNRKMWKLIRASFPQQVWLGCMAHEASLLMTDIMKIPEVRELHVNNHMLVKWVNNKGGVLKIFREVTRTHFTKKGNQSNDPNVRKACRSRETMGMYTPGDTRMLATFKMVFRVTFLRACVVGTCQHADYEETAQRAIKTYNSGQKDQAKKIKKRDRGGMFVDAVYDKFSRSDCLIYHDNELFLQSVLAITLLHRVVDTYAPSLSKVYYCCCLVDKHLRSLRDMGQAEIGLSAPYCNKVFDLFVKRWTRWHHPVHTLAYHLDPAFQSHAPSEDELVDCEAACKMLYPHDVADIMLGITKFKGLDQSEATCYDRSVWAKVDAMQPHMWHKTYSHAMKNPAFKKASMEMCSMPSPASVCEQGGIGWSKVGLVETARRGRLQPSKTCKLVNVCGTEWLKDIVLADEDKATTRVCEIMAMLDGMVAETQEQAASMGLSEAGDDVYGYDDHDGNLEHEPEAEAPNGSAAVVVADTTVDGDAGVVGPPEALTSAEDAADDGTPENSDAEDGGEPGEEEGLFSIPKDNARMEAMLPALPEFRACDFISRRRVFE